MKKSSRRNFLRNFVGLASGVLLTGAFSNTFADSNKNQKVKFKQNTLNPSQEAARNVAKNLFGLVYENAISKNEKGKVHIQQVSYKTRGLKAENPYKNSKTNDIGKLYYENGNLMTEILYKNDEMVGMQKGYMPNGGIIHNYYISRGYSHKCYI